MITLFISLLLGVVVNVAPADRSKTYALAVLRQEYLQASKDEAAAKQFHKKMAAYTEKHPVRLAYKGGSEAVMAKYHWNPYSKLKYLRTAASYFEEAVALDKTNPEVRFLRFTVEHYIPRYLNLSGHLAEDKSIIIDNLKKYPNSSLSAEMARTIKDFMLTKDHCTEAEKQEIRSININ
ncbi:hypothetical protein [uncultured Pontibacter sp.]|uniref:hypothetical protein n=1 Tax=uncultured Pontibacter sp. TaxID=453356 RepID=UPI0026332DA0|nr:hypothetical protein [uncultured Pontibacter sp.]